MIYTKRDLIFILTLIISMVGGSIYLGKSLFYGFFTCNLLMSIFLFQKGCELKKFYKSVLNEVLVYKKLYIFILLIGANVSIWLLSGVVPTIMYYGFEYMKGFNFLFMSFLIISFMSVFIGSAVGTIGTVGVAIIGVAKGFLIPTPVIVGVVVSAAFIADKISPLSGLLNLSITVCDSNYKDTIKAMLKTFIPIYVIVMLIYYYMGINYDTSNASNIIIYQDSIKSAFNISLGLFLFPLLMIILSCMGVDVLNVVFIGLSLGSVVSYFMQNNTIKNILYTMYKGYENNNLGPLSNTLKSGGLYSMIEVVLIVVMVVILGEILRQGQIIDSAFKLIDEKIQTNKQILMGSVITSIFLTLITCDQTLGIVITSKTFKEKYEKAKYKKELLIRNISDTGTIIAPIIPININSIIIFGITGVSALEYGPYSILCYLFPLLSFGYISSIDIKLSHRQSS